MFVPPLESFAIELFEELLLCSRHVVKFFFAAASDRGQACAMAQSLLVFLFRAVVEFAIPSGQGLTAFVL